MGSLCSYYKQHLAKRLLQSKSTDVDVEKSMITKLKTECGCQFTAKLESMFKDVAVWPTLNEKWKEETMKSASDQEKSIELDVRVLTAGSWPTQASQSCELPAEMKHIWERYHRFYVNKHSGRKIALVPFMGGGEMVAYFYGVPGGDAAATRTPAVNRDSEQSEQMDASSSSARMLAEPRKHILALATPQMIIMQLFAERNKLTCQVRALWWPNSRCCRKFKRKRS